MIPVRLRLARCVALIAAISATTPDAAAQVPPGTAVVCTHAGSGTGTPGLFLVPLGNGPTTPVAITGLPPELHYTGPNTAPQGAAAVAYRATDGAILVCTTGAATGPFGGAIQLFVLHLMNGNAVDPSRTQSILLGTTTNVGGAMLAILPDDQVLVGGGQQGGAFPSGPMAGHLFAIVNASGVVTTLPNPPVAAAAIGGFTIDPTAKSLYAVSMVNLNTATPTTNLHRLELATNTVCQIATWPNEVAFGVTCDDDGRVYVSSTDVLSVTHTVHTVVPDGCNPAAVTSQPSSLSLAPAGIALERTSGRFAVTSSSRPGYAPSSLSLIDPATGTATVIASPPVGGWGRMGQMGVAVHDGIESYGACSDGQDHYWFDNFPNPGGQPNLGNLGNPNFSLTMASGTGTAFGSAITLSLGRGSLSVLGIEILVDLTTAVTQFVPPGPSVVYPLPVPPGLSGVVLTAQSVHLEPGNVFAASRGLMLTL